jgi:hypothetical protein
MSVISDTAILKWGNKFRKYYEERGYIYTKQGDILEVKIKDLPNNSVAIVNIQCDGECREIRPMKWQNYKNHSQLNGEYYCQKCIGKYKKENGIKSKCYKEYDSFEDWCLENNREDWIELWDYTANNGITPRDVGYSANKKYYFKCPKGIHKSENVSIGQITKSGNLNCRQCNSFAQYLINTYGENALDLYWSNENTVSPWDFGFGSHIPIKIKCQDKLHHIYDTMPNRFKEGKRCSYCDPFASHKVHILDSLGTLYPDVFELWSDKNMKTPYEYTPFSKEEVWWKCPNGKHEDYYRDIGATQRFEYRCAKCTDERDESFLEEKVRLYLAELNYQTLQEYKSNLKCVNPKTNYPLPYDNEVIELKLIIEVNGKHHYEIVNWNRITAKQKNTTPEYQLHMQQVRDRYKRMWAKKQGYDFLEVPYWLEDNDEYKTLIDNKIKEIQNSKLNKAS